MTTEIALPDYLKDMIDDGSSQNLISVTSSVPRISLKGRKFRLIVDGEEIKKINDEMHVVILGTQPERGMAKTFYKGAYNPDDSGPPDCSSSGGISPDSWVNDPQCDACAKCLNNVWGSATAMSGKKAKACRDSKRLMVVEARDLEGTIYILNVTVSSLKNLSQYGKLLVSNNMPMAAAITTLIMDDESDYPKLDFAFAGAMKEVKGRACLERASKKEWDEFNQQAIAHDGDGKDKPKQLEQSEETEEPEKAVKGEIVDEKKDEKKDDSPMSDVDDLLDGWDE